MIETLTSLARRRPGPRPASGPPGTRAGAAAIPARRRWLADVLIAAAVTAVEVGGTAAAGAQHHAHHHAPGVASYLLLAASGVSLIARRRYPVAVLAITLGLALATAALGDTGVAWLALIVAFFTAVQARRRAAAIASLVIGYLVSVWPPWLLGTGDHPSVTFALTLLIGLLVLLSAAELIRSGSQRAQALRRSQEEELRRRASEDRMRMARDLHDVVAHNISVINVQANTALHLMDRQPQRAREALTTINDVSRQALAELRSVLGVLRGVDEGGAGRDAPRAPAPGLGRLDELAATMRAAGLAVRVERGGSRIPLPGGADLAAYRIVQEAVTNTARHSGSSAATVRITYREDGVEIEVDDDGGPERPAPGPGGGHGIAGMTERAQAFGGWLQAGPRPGGGFRVQAWLPAQPDDQPAESGDRWAEAAQQSGPPGRGAS
ncbi:MAG TPA: histidine kinase [Streptosporangiaceae bacterium]|nr:histidine kinase [Streptosporangiaceae bacterium]